jgi:hypothetical protein
MMNPINAMNNLPDISEHDSPRLREFMRITAVEIKAVGGVGAATSLEMIGYIRELESQLRAKTAATEAQRCVECGHNEGVDAHGQCKHISPSAFTKSIGDCSCACVFPARLPADTAEQTWCDHCSADLNGVKHILCERCYREYAGPKSTDPAFSVAPDTAAQQARETIHLLVNKERVCGASDSEWATAAVERVNCLDCLRDALRSRPVEQEK